MSSFSSRPDYTGVTETPGTLISRDAASMAMSRYELVRRHAAGRRVLEVACGSGQGLGYVARAGARLVAGDITHSLLARARDTYDHGLPIVQFDAHALPFAAGSFDIVAIHEAIYYMASPEQVFAECHRVLAPGGLLFVSSINPAWRDFNPSPHATRYLSHAELRIALARTFASVDVLFGFRVPRPTAVAATVSAIKRVAVRLRLIPKTMRGKTPLKRLFLGPLVTVPVELREGTAPLDEPTTLSVSDPSSFRVIYAIARR